MKILNEFNLENNSETIKEAIVRDLVTKIGCIRGNYPGKVDSVTNLEILMRHYAFDDMRNTLESQMHYVDFIWDDWDDIYGRVIKYLPISKYFFGKTTKVRIRWFYYDDKTVTYTVYVK